MIRLQRVTFLALHDYLGLTTELTRSSDEPSQVRTHDQRHRRRVHSHSHATVLDSIPANTTDILDMREEDSSESQSFAPVRSLSDVQATSTPNTAADQNQPNPTTVSSVPEGQLPSILTSKERAASFTGQRSHSVIESRTMKPDFEEAAARARVKNSIDTTFFEKHKISYPNVANSRSSNTNARRRSSFSDVKSLDHLFLTYLH